MLRIKRILAPVDFSACSRQALDVAVDMARTYGAKLDILHVFEELALPSFYGAGAIMVYGKVPDLEAEAEKAITQLADAVKTNDIDIATHIRKGHPADEISAFAHDMDNDLIVIATHGLTGLRHVVLGSVAERVVRESPCPVFVVKTHGKPISSITEDSTSRDARIDASGRQAAPDRAGTKKTTQTVEQNDQTPLNSSP